MTLWKIIVIGMGLLTLRRMIQGFPVWDVRLSDGRVIRVLEARRDPDDTNVFAGDPTRVHGKRFKVTFDGDEMRQNRPIGLGLTASGIRATRGAC
jgi:hypothetical protein